MHPPIGEDAAPNSSIINLRVEVVDRFPAIWSSLYHDSTVLLTSDLWLPIGCQLPAAAGQKRPDPLLLPDPGHRHRAGLCRRQRDRVPDQLGDHGLGRLFPRPDRSAGRRQPAGRNPLSSLHPCVHTGPVRTFFPAGRGRLPGQPAVSGQPRRGDCRRDRCFSAGGPSLYRFFLSRRRRRHLRSASSQRTRQ